MTIDEAKRMYGVPAKDFYVTCASCPLDINTCLGGNGLHECWEAIAKHFSATEDKAETPSHISLHSDVCDELKELYFRKNTDYGDSFHKTFIEEGMAMSRIRLTDKLERFKRLTKSGEQNVKDESVRDTLIDLANYAIMTIVEMERESDDKD